MGEGEGTASPDDERSNKAFWSGADHGVQSAEKRSDSDLWSSGLDPEASGLVFKLSHEWAQSTALWCPTACCPRRRMNRSSFYDIYHSTR